MMTLTGWIAVLGGLWRMVVPSAPQAAGNVLTYAVLAAICAIGAMLRLKAYGSSTIAAQRPPDA
jgi:hypothetical protein